MSDQRVDEQPVARPRFARFLHRFSVLIILAWLAIAVVVTVAVPPLEQVERDHAISLSPQDAPSVQAMTRMGKLFKESNSENVGVLVLEGDKPLGDDAHRYYDSIVRQLKDDQQHVQHVQDFWGDPLTAGAAQSADGKAAYAQLNLAGQMGQALGNESVDAVQAIVDRTPPPPGVKAYVTGPAAVVADMGKSGNSTVLLITAVSMAVIFVMLLLVFRSFVTTILLLFMVGIQLQVARGFVAFLGDHGVVGLTTYVVNLLVSVGIAAGTDYGIFFAGRYQEARQAGEDKESAFYTTYRSVAKVVLASGLTIAGAIFCLSFTRLPFFQPLGVPGAVGILVAVAVSLTLMPAVMAAGSRFGLFEPKRKIKTFGWRRVGTAIVRWPAPILVASLAIAFVGLLAVPNYQPSYSDQKFIPKDIPANVGLTAAARHFPQSRMSTPDILMIESDHDMRNTSDFLVLNKLAKAVFAVPGVAEVQSVTRPEGKPIDHTTIPFMLSMQNASQRLYLPFQKDRMDDMLKQADEMTDTISLMQHMNDIMKQMVDTTHRLSESTHELKATTEELRNHVADFDDFLRPIRNYFYWEPHCYDVPLCQAFRSIFDGLDGIDEVTDKMGTLVQDIDQLDALLPQMLTTFPQMIATMQSQRQMMLTMHSTMSGIMAQQDDAGQNPTA
ncbi:MAG: putative drug exporter of the superfamily, partial [Mycobacterium sp.]|nr:putative drug exporter of the superfamily [Mycobacterium sp.]